MLNIHNIEIKIEQIQMIKEIINIQWYTDS